MPFYPAHKLTIKYTPGNELIRTNYQPYVGSYIQASDGRLFEGEDKKRLGSELFRSHDVDEEGSSFGGSKYTRKFNYLNKPISKRLDNVLKVPYFKSFPQEEDYKKGFYIRYFTKRINGSKYMEISEKIYNSLKSKEGKYDHNLYIIGEIKWYLIGNIIQKQNSQEILKKQNIYPNLFNLFPILDEFANPGNIITENQQTEGGELYRADGSEYIGLYHIHPTNGPMVGPVHTSIPHDKLYYFDQLPEPTPPTMLTCYKCMYPYTQAATVAHIQAPITKEGCPEGTMSDYYEAAMSCFDSDYNEGGTGAISTGDNDIHQTYLDETSGDGGGGY
jgi:hypothetical protein